MGEEADYLDELGMCEQADNDMRELEQQAYYDNVDKMKARYRDNQRAAIGTTIRCAYCARRILKKAYQTQFCNNKGKDNCKDAYWNNTDDNRREQAQRYSK